MRAEHHVSRSSLHCRSRLAAIFFLTSLNLATPQGVGAVGQEFVPVENWAYDAVRRFETLGMCRLSEDQPYNRTEFIAIVSEISRNTFVERLSPRDRYQLARLEKEFTNFAGRRDPQARYDPPTFYVKDDPLLLTGDIDVVGYVQELPFANDTGAFLQTNPEFQLHFGDHVTYDLRYRIIFGPEDGGRADDQKPSRRERSFNGLTSLFERSYVIAGWEKYFFYFGRDYVNWGPADWNNLIVPGDTYSVDQIGGRIGLKSLRLSFFQGLLSPATERRFAAHRLEIGWKSAVFGLNESVVYTGSLDPIYFFPLSSFYANQFNERNNDDNVMWSVDTKVNFKRKVTLYGSLLIDDAQFEGDGENPNKFAFDIGGRFALSRPFAATVHTRYRFVDIYTYTHEDSSSVYVSGEGELDAGDVLLGGEPGPDSDQWRIELEVYPRANVFARGAVIGERRGEGNDFRSFTPGDPVDPPFPSGVTQRTRTFAAELRWEFDRNQWVRGVYGFTQGHNLGHVLGADENSHSFRVELRLEIL